MVGKLLGYGTLSRLNKLVFWLGLVAGICLLLAYIATHIDPAGTAWMALFGLAYPVLVIVNLVLLLYWALKKHRQVWFFVLVMALGFNHHRHFFQLSTSGTAVEGASQLKVMSYNVRLFDLYNWTDNMNTRNRIFELIELEAPDVLCFQEFYHDQQGGAFLTLDTLTQILDGYSYHEGYTAQLGTMNFGLCTFSRYPIVAQGELTFNENRSNNCIYSDLLIGNDTVRVYNAHIGSVGFQYADYEFVGGKGFPKYPSDPTGEQQVIPRLMKAFEKRSEQVTELAAHLDACTYETIVCCDLNDIPVSYSYRVLTNSVFDAFTEAGNGIGSTYVGNFPFLRIDYIMHSAGIEPLEFTTIDNDLSDHRPITCTFQLAQN